MASLTERPGKTGTSSTVRWRERGTQQRKIFRRKEGAEAWQHDTAVLEPSTSGAPMYRRMYRRMGFEPLTTYLEAVISPLDGP